MVDMKDVLKIAVTMIVLDFVWIGLVSGGQFKKMIETIQSGAMRVRPLGAFVAYAAIIALFYTFKDDLTILKAFLLGLCTYAIYDGTNYALFSGWDMKTALVDSLWGGGLFVLTKLITDALS
jgi:uncharacterized membrane protein